MAQDKVVIDITAKDKTSKGINKSTGAFKKMAKTLGPLITIGFGVAAIKAAADAYSKQENAIAQLEQRLKSTNNAVGISSQKLQEMASSLQKVTTFGDETIIEMQSLLLTFTKIGGDTFPQATEAILNMSTAMDQDLKTSAIQVGKALNDPVAGIAAMSRSGIQFTDTQKDMIKSLTETGDLLGAQTIILSELETQFGGAARAAKDTFGGAMQSLANTFGDEVFEALGKSGSGFIPLMQTLEDLLTSETFRTGMADLSTAFSDIGWALGKVGEGMDDADGFFSFLDSDIAQTVKDLSPLVNAFRLLGAARNASTGGRQPVPPPPVGGFVSPSEQQSRNRAAAKITETEELKVLEIQQTEDMWEQINLQLEYAEFKFQKEEEIRQRSIAANKDATDRKAQQERDAADAGMTALSDLGSLINSESRKAFEIGKAASIASTIIQTYKGATSAFASLAETGPWGVAAGIAAAAAAIAAGLANVQAIQSTQFGGGGGGQPAVPNITPSTIGPQSQPQATQTAAISQLGGENIEVRTGSVLGVFIEEQLIPAMNEANRRGVKLIVA